MIFLTGDTHGNIDIKKLNTKNFPEQRNLTKDDILIVLGDFGLNNRNIKQEEYFLKWLEKKTFTILFLDGNHEEFPVLNNYPEVEIYGGKAHKLGKNIYHLMRGEIFNIEGKTFFVMGGAESHAGKLITMDEYKKHKRKYTVFSEDYVCAYVIGKDWFKEELPSEEELKYGLNNLQLHNNCVDYILSHSASNRVESFFNRPSPKNASGWHICDYFDQLEQTINYKKWFFGHYHRDEVVDEKHQCLYNTIIKI